MAWHGAQAARLDQVRTDGYAVASPEAVGANSAHVGMPSAPARCITNVSWVTTRSISRSQTASSSTVDVCPRRSLTIGGRTGIGRFGSGCPSSTVATPACSRPSMTRRSASRGTVRTPSPSPTAMPTIGVSPDRSGDGPVGTGIVSGDSVGSVRGSSPQGMRHGLRQRTVRRRMLLVHRFEAQHRVIRGPRVRGQRIRQDGVHVGAETEDTRGPRGGGDVDRRLRPAPADAAEHRQQRHRVAQAPDERDDDPTGSRHRRVCGIERHRSSGHRIGGDERPRLLAGSNLPVVHHVGDAALQADGRPPLLHRDVDRCRCPNDLHAGDIGPTRGAR